MTDPTPIRLVVGDDWAFPFTYKDATGQPINLTGFTPGGDVIFPGGRLAMSARLLDQSVLENRGKFILDVDKSETNRLPSKKLGTHLRAYLVDASGDQRSFPAWPLDVEPR